MRVKNGFQSVYFQASNRDVSSVLQISTRNPEVAVLSLQTFLNFGG